MACPSTVATACLELLGPPFWADAVGTNTRELAASNLMASRLKFIRGSISQTGKVKQRARQGQGGAGQFAVAALQACPVRERRKCRGISTGCHRPPLQKQRRPAGASLQG